MFESATYSKFFSTIQSVYDAVLTSIRYNKQTCIMLTYAHIIKWIMVNTPALIQIGPFGKTQQPLCELNVFHTFNPFNFFSMISKLNDQSLLDFCRENEFRDVHLDVRFGQECMGGGGRAGVARQGSRIMNINVACWLIWLEYHHHQ